MTTGDRPIYGIRAVARMLDLAPGTIRNWEERYGLVRPARSPGGQRLYSRDDLERLQFVAEQVADGASAADAHRLLEERLLLGEALHEPEADATEILVMLAERDPYALRLAEFLLTTEGFAVEVAGTPAEVLRAFDAHGPSLVIVDLMLGGGQGVALCAELKRRGAAIVVATSALQVADEALAAGADAFLARPVDSLVLISTVKDLLERSALVRSPNRIRG
jgi:CheY-like chemotaxis protein